MPIPESLPEPAIPDDLLSRGTEMIQEIARRAYRIGHRDGWTAGWRAGLAQYIRPKKRKREASPPHAQEVSAEASP